VIGPGWPIQDSRDANGVDSVLWVLLGVTLLIEMTRINVSAANRKELFLTICSLVDSISAEPGCTSYRVYVEEGNDTSMVLIGEWETKEDWENYQRSSGFAVLVGAINVLSCRVQTDRMLF